MSRCKEATSIVVSGAFVFAYSRFGVVIDLRSGPVVAGGTVHA